MAPFRNSPPAALGPIALASLVVIMAWLVMLRQPDPTRFAPVGAVPIGAERPVPAGLPTPTPAPLAGSYASSSPELYLVVAEGLLDPQDQARLAADLERAMDYVAQRFATAPKGQISTYVGLEPTCGIHGIAYTDVRTVQVFTCRDLPLSRAVNILAHEYVHQLSHDRYGDRHLQADLILLEGVATWGAGAYWLGDAPDFRSFVRPWLERGEQLPLAQSYVGLPISDMNKLYYQWASFVEYLLATYGQEAFDALYVTGSSAPGSADYSGVYGKSLDLLEAEWQAWVLG